MSGNNYQHTLHEIPEGQKRKVSCNESVESHSMPRFPLQRSPIVLKGVEAQLFMLFFFSLSMSCVPTVLCDMM
jgi:hypothetical protein